MYFWNQVRSHEVEDRFGGIISTSLGRVAFIIEVSVVILIVQLNSSIAVTLYYYHEHGVSQLPRLQKCICLVGSVV